MTTLLAPTPAAVPALPMAAPTTPATALHTTTLALTDPRWFAFVRARPEATIFHHPLWAALLAECYGFRPIALALADAEGRIVAGLPVIERWRPVGPPRWAALPYTDHCPPLGDTATLPLLRAAATEWAGAAGVGSFVVHADFGDAPAGASAYVRHTAALASSVEAQFKRLAKANQRNIRMAERGGVTVRLGQTRADLEVFRQLHRLTRQRLGVPTQPRRFFDLLADWLLANDHGFVAIASYGAAPAAAAVFLHDNGTLIYKFGASDERFWRMRPNNSALWAGMRWGVEHGCHTFDLGRSDRASDGLRRFKDTWGATETPLAYTALLGPAVDAAPGRARQALGAVIRRSPPWLGEAVGALAYRYAG